MGFPTIYIPNYKGTPIPVVDRESGELVSIITKPEDFADDPPRPPVSVIPGNNPVGLTTDDPRFNVVLGGFYIENTGFDYKDPVIQIFDRDRDELNGEARAVLSQGRIVNVEIINTGTGFKRLPEVQIIDPTGFGSVIFPVLNLIPREAGENPAFKPDEKPIEAIFCQSRDLKNLF
jgi:hypothetical protein